MKRFYLYFIFVVFAVSLFAQKSDDYVNVQRDSIYKRYKQHNDTMTINTWLNIMNAKKQLESLLFYDSLIIEKLSKKLSKKFIADTTLFKLNENFDLLKIKNSHLIENFNESDAEKKYFQNMFTITVISTGLLLIVSIVLIVLFGRLKGNIKRKDKEIKNHLTDLFSMRELIRKSEITEKKMASEINNINKQRTEDLEEMRLEKDFAIQEKSMLDNQIIEIKKAYDSVVQKCKDIENRQSANISPNKDMIENDDHTKNIVSKPESDLEDIKDEKDKIFNDLELALKKNTEYDKLIEQHATLKNDYDIEVETRKRIEKELKLLIEKLNSHFKL